MPVVQATSEKTHSQINFQIAIALQLTSCPLAMADPSEQAAVPVEPSSCSPLTSQPGTLQPQCLPSVSAGLIGPGIQWKHSTPAAQCSVSFVKFGMRQRTTVDNRIVVSKQPCPTTNWCTQASKGVPFLHDLVSCNPGCNVFRAARFCL